MAMDWIEYEDPPSLRCFGAAGENEEDAEERKWGATFAIMRFYSK
jgi:hypothetical protein